MLKRRLRLLCACVLLITSLSAIAQGQADYPSDGLIGYWPFNESASDESGSARHGTVVGVVPSHDRYDYERAAYEFSDDSHVISIPDALQLLSSDFSISLWFESDHYDRMELMSLVRQADNNSGLRVSFNANGWGTAVSRNDDGSNLVRTGVSRQFTDGFWHNMIIIRTGSELKLYLDGILRGRVDGIAAMPDGE